MASTTKDEESVPEVVVAKSVSKKDVEALYNKGQNIYQIAQEVYGFQGDEAVANIKRILGKGNEVHVG